MRSNEAHLEFAPTSDGGEGRALILALAVHALLLLALNWGTLWSQQPQDMSVEAELWSAIPQPVAPKSELPPEPDVPPTPEPEPQPEPPSPVAPPVKPSETAKPVVDPQIAIDKLKKKQVEEKQQQAQEDKKAKRKAEKEEEAKLKAKEKQEAEARHQAAVKRLQSMAGSAGMPVDTGVAPTPSSPTANNSSKATLLGNKVMGNITFTNNLKLNLSGKTNALVDITCNSNGRISMKLVKPSGNPAWDQAVINGFNKTEILPHEIDCSITTKLTFKPLD